MTDRPGGTRFLDRRIAELLGWSRIAEAKGIIDLSGVPPGAEKREPVPFYSSVQWLARRAAKEAEALLGLSFGDLPSEPWRVCENVVEECGKHRARKGLHDL